MFLLLFYKSISLAVPLKIYKTIPNKIIIHKSTKTIVSITRSNPYVSQIQSYKLYKAQIKKAITPKAIAYIRILTKISSNIATFPHIMYSF